MTQVGLLRNNQKGENIMRKSLTPRVLLLIPVAVAVNFIGILIATALKLSMGLEMVGTIFVGAVAGPLPAIITGTLTNVILGLFSYDWVPYAVVQIVCGVVVGYAARKGAFKDWKWTALTAFAIWGATLLASVSVTTILYGDITSGSGSVIGTFINTTAQGLGVSITTKVILFETLDKFLSTFIVFFTITTIPYKFLYGFPLSSLYVKE